MRKITQEIAQRIIDEYVSGKDSASLQKRFGLSKNYITRIVSGETWKNCKRPSNIHEITLQRKKNLGGSKISQETAQQIIYEFCQGSSANELAEQYGLWQTSICNLISGRSWKNCKRPENIKEIIQKRSEQSQFQEGRFVHNDLPPLSNEQNQIVTGSLLGDGFLRKTSNNNRNSCFGKKQCLKFHEYLKWHNAIFESYSSSMTPMKCKEKLSVDEYGKIERTEIEEHINGYRFQTVCHPIFTEMRRKWYPNDKKIVPLDIRLTPLAIAIWFCDDGSNSFSNREAIFCTQSFTPDECQFLCNKLSDFNIRSRVRFRKYASGNKPIIKVNSTSYDNLIQLIKPHITWKCMSHKIKWRRAKKHYEIHGQLNEEQVTEIRNLRKSISAKEISKQYNVHVNTIYSIVSGRSYRGVGE